MKFYIEQFICVNALPWSALKENHTYAWVRLPIEAFDSFSTASAHAKALPQFELRITDDEGHKWSTA